MYGDSNTILTLSKHKHYAALHHEFKNYNSSFKPGIKGVIMNLLIEFEPEDNTTP